MIDLDDRAVTERAVRRFVTAAPSCPGSWRGDRYAAVVAAPTADAWADRLAERSAHLQNVVVGAAADELPRLVDRLIEHGACRVSPDVPGLRR